MNENSICEFWHQAGAIPGVDYCPEAQTFADVMPRAHLWLCPVCRRGQYLQCAAAGSWLPLPEPCARRRLRTVATRFAGELRAASSVESHTNTRAAAPEPPPEQRGFWAALARDPWLVADFACEVDAALALPLPGIRGPLSSKWRRTAGEG